MTKEVEQLRERLRDVDNNIELAGRLVETANFISYNKMGVTLLEELYLRALGWLFGWAHKWKDRLVAERMGIQMSLRLLTQGDGRV